MKSDSKNMVWLASYPKSGNTWVRIFLNYILNPGIHTHGFPDLSDIPIASNRVMMDRYLGINSSELHWEEVTELRPEVYRKISIESGKLKVLKVHDAYQPTPSGAPMFPEEISLRVIYLVRNPLDVAVSYAFHTGNRLDLMIQQLNDPSFRIAGSTGGVHAQVAQRIGSWTQHVAGWTSQKQIPVTLIRYEDLIDQPELYFREILEDLNIPYDQNLISRVVQLCNFSRLKNLEENDGFMEKPVQSKAFFREGKKDIYLTRMDTGQIQKILSSHGDMMKKMGYPAT